MSGFFDGCLPTPEGQVDRDEHRLTVRFQCLAGPLDAYHVSFNISIIQDVTDIDMNGTVASELRPAFNGDARMFRGACP